jgi:hypothetical protein
MTIANFWHPFGLYSLVVLAVNCRGCPKRILYHKPHEPIRRRGDIPYKLTHIMRTTIRHQQKVCKHTEGMRFAVKKFTFWTLLF